MGILKSILTGLLSFIVFTTLPFAITSYFFLQQMDTSNLGGDIGGTVLGTILQESGFIDQISEQLAQTLPEMQMICTMYPEWGMVDIFTNISGAGMDMGGAEALIDAILPCFDVPCSEIVAMDSQQLSTRMNDQLSDCDIELPPDFIENFNMSDFGGGDFGGFDFGGILGQVQYFGQLFERYVIYLIIAGVICSVLLLVISRDIAYFSRRMGMIFLITGISFIVFTFVLRAILPGLLSGMFAGMGDTVTSIIDTLVFEPLDGMMIINIIYIIGGSVGVGIGMFLQKRKTAEAEFETK